MKPHGRIPLVATQVGFLILTVFQYAFPFFRANRGFSTSVDENVCAYSELGAWGKARKRFLRTVSTTILALFSLNSNRALAAQPKLESVAYELGPRDDKSQSMYAAMADSFSGGHGSSNTGNSITNCRG